MTRDEIISMAREAGLQSIEEHWGTVYRAVGPSNLEYFAGLVAAREREECAKACEDVATTRWDEYAASYNSAVFDCVAAIRARAGKETT